MELLYLSREDVEQINLPMDEIIAVLEQMFLEKGRGKTEMPSKMAIHPRPECFINAMPGWIPGLNAAGMKWLSAFPLNKGQGLPYVSGLMILSDPATGFPIAVMDCTWITAQRTGAATAVAAKYLARRDSETVGIVACGVQGRSNLAALACVLEIERVKAYDRHPERSAAFAREMSERLNIEIEPVSRLEEAVRGMDVVVTSGAIAKQPAPAIEAGWLPRGSFASLVDYDSTWTGAALSEVEKLATDDRAQMEFYRSEGYFQQTPGAYADLGEIVGGLKPGRESASERTIAMNLGIALCDVATATRIFQQARELKVGRRLPL